METKEKALEIFYADDALSDRLLFKIALDEISIPSHLKTAIDGREAMLLLNENNEYAPDLIFLDLKMPFKDGNECLQEIRRNSKFSITPVIIFSSSCEEKDIKEAYTHNANLYAQKPFDLNHQVVLMKRLFTLDWKEYFPPSSQEEFVFKI